MSSGTINTILGVAYGMMTLMRIAFFALLTMGIVNMIRSNYYRASWLLLIAAILCGIVEAGIAGGVKAGMKNIDEQMERNKKNQ
jgi:hypothetical protein